MLATETPSVHREFPADLTSARAAREFAGAAVGQWGFPPSVIVVVVSELATNAIVHGGTPFRVTLTANDDGVMIQVDDASPVPPRRCTRDRAGTNGRGLLIVEQFADAWGVEFAPPTGKRVWAHIADTMLSPGRRRPIRPLAG